MGFYAAENLSESWRHSCLKALGLEDWVVLDQQERKPTANKFQVINLLPQEDEHDEGAETSAEGVSEDDTTGDQWMQTALQIQSNILEMAGWIAQKRSDYISLEMPDEEASLIQSTVTSFTATTASEIETLHQCIQQQHDKKTGTNQHQHCSGIVQILMSQLKEGIAEPFGKLQKTRTRAAVQLWQTPLQCRLWTPRHHRLRGAEKKDPTLELLGLDDDDDERPVTVDQRFQPSRPSHRLHRDFWSSYEYQEGSSARQKRPPRPGFVVGVANDEDDRSEEQPLAEFTAAKAASLRQQKQQQQQQFQMMPEDDETTVNAAALQQEAVMLQAVTQNDLDSVQKMEQTMADITTLLSQFANLVAEQQEDVWEIHDSAATTKENMQKGQENLHEAKERTVASSHYMAKGIFAMGCLLLLLNWLVA